MTDSNFEKIKKLMKIVGGKVIIVEDGKPTMVVINIDEYVDFNNVKDRHEMNAEKEGSVERANLDVSAWKRRQQERMIGQIENELNFPKKDGSDDFYGTGNNADEMVIEEL
ncbi:MAG: hypothetical protein WA063_02090 [Minisyncoccia bacterium]